MRQFSYVLLFLILASLWDILPVYSQESTEESNGQPNPTEQATEKPLYLESQLNALITQFRMLETRLNDLEDSSDTPFKTFVTVFGALIVLTLIAVIILGMRKIREQQDRLEASKRQWRIRFNQSTQNWEAQLKHIGQRGRDNTLKLEEIASGYASISHAQENLQNNLSNITNRLDGFDLTLANLGSEWVPDVETNAQSELETLIQETRAQVETLAHAYENGEPMDPIEIENPTPSQNTLLILNQIAFDLDAWKTELEDAGTANSDLIAFLGYANQTIKDNLREIRGQQPRLSIPFELHIDNSTDVAKEFQDRYNAYVSSFKGMLRGYQMGCTVDESEYNQFIPQFIKDRLFNGVARFLTADQVSEHLKQFLALVGYEIIPIEIGKTEADPRVHDIQESKQTHEKPGTVVEVVTPGLQWKADGEIVQKPAVIRGE